jgi:hypothetical protein
MHMGAFDAYETMLFCPHDKTIFASQQLRSLAPKGGQLWLRCHRRGRHGAFCPLPQSSADYGDVGKDLLKDDYTALYKRMQKLNVRALLRQKARYLEQKIDPATPVLDEIV